MLCTTRACSDSTNRASKASPVAAIMPLKSEKFMLCTTTRACSRASEPPPVAAIMPLKSRMFMLSTTRACSVSTNKASKATPVAVIMPLKSGKKVHALHY